MIRNSIGETLNFLPRMEISNFKPGHSLKIFKNISENVA